MTRRLLRVRVAEQLAGELHAPLAELARTSTHRVLVTPRLVLSGAYLVPDNGVEPFRDAVARLARRHHEVLLACTGPWPPYSFAAINGAAA